MMLLILFLSCVLNLQPLSAIDWPKVVQSISKQSHKHPVTQVFGGASNVNYRLELDGKHYFIRFAPQDQESLYAKLDIEYQVLSALQTLDICPQPVYCDLTKRVLVTEYLFNEPESVNLLDAVTRESVLKHLRAIETSGAKVDRIFCPYDDVMQLVETAYASGCPSFKDEFYTILLPQLKRIDTILSKNPKKTLCHLDLHNKNVLKQKSRFWIVDWEYATMSHPYLVLASMASIEGWSDDQMLELLQEYTVGANETEFARLYLYRIVADIFWSVWNHIQAHCSLINNPYEQWEKGYFSSALKRLQAPEFEKALSAVILAEKSSQEVVLLFGPPGAGKGTFAEYAVSRFGYGHISAGDLVRNEINRQTVIGLEVKEIVRRGDYIDPEMMFQLVKNRAMEYVACNRPFIIDGYGRTFADAKRVREFVEEIEAHVFVLFLEAPDVVCKDRIFYRLVCPTCLSIFNQKMGVKSESKCPKCRESILQMRLNDTPEVIEKRLKLYRDEIHPCYQTFLVDLPSAIFNTDRDLESCYDFYHSLLESLNPMKSVTIRTI